MALHWPSPNLYIFDSDPFLIAIAQRDQEKIYPDVQITEYISKERFPQKLISTSTEWGILLNIVLLQAV